MVSRVDTGWTVNIPQVFIQGVFWLVDIKKMSQLGSAVVVIQITHQIGRSLFTGDFPLTLIMKGVGYGMFVGAVANASYEQPEWTLFALVILNTFVYFSKERKITSKEVICPFFLTEMLPIANQFLIANQTHLKRIGQAINSDKRPDAIIIAKSGVGKTTLVEMAASETKNEKSPFYKKRFFVLDLNLFLGDTKTMGTLEGRTTALFNFTQSDPNIIVFIDELHQILEAGKKSYDGMDGVVEQWKTALTSKRIRLIGATTPDMHQQMQKRDPAFTRRLEPIRIQEPSKPECLKILQQLTQDETFKDVQFQTQELEFMIELTSFFDLNIGQPSKAIELMTNIAQAHNEEEKLCVTQDHILEAYALYLGIKKEKILPTLKLFQSLQQGEILNDEISDD